MHVLGTDTQAGYVHMHAHAPPPTHTYTCTIANTYAQSHIVCSTGTHVDTHVDTLLIQSDGGPH